MAVFQWERGWPGSCSRGPKRLARRWADPRTLLGFSSLLTVGIAGMDGLIALLSPGPEARLFVGALSVATIAACWTVTLAVAWFVLLIRCLVAIGGALSGPTQARASRRKPRAMASPAGVSDQWLDGPG